MSQSSETKSPQTKGTIGPQEDTLAANAAELADLSFERDALQDALRTQTETAAQLASRLDAIHRSRGWKTLLRFYRLRDALLPNKGLRRKMAGFARDVWGHLDYVRRRRTIRSIASSGLFDSAWYLKQNPDVASTGLRPLDHYMRRGAREGRDPNPFFDSAWYLKQNPDVASAGLNPLEHYLRHGALQGRDPSPRFDSARYLQSHPDVAKAGENPLAHFLRSQAAALLGADGGSGGSAASGSLGREGRPDLVPRPIPLPAGAQKPASPGVCDRRLICVSHVLPYPSRAGNEYRIHRMLNWLAAQGFEVFLVVCPLPGDSISPQRLAAACSVYPNIIVCQRDGTLLYRLSDAEAIVKKLSGIKAREFDKILGEKSARSSGEMVLSMTRLFCPSVLMEVLQQLDAILKPQVLWVNYVWMTRVFPLLRPELLKVVDTHDVFSTKRDKVTQFGIEDRCTLTSAEEAKLLKGADLIVSIQSTEEEDLRRLAPGTPVATAGVDFDFIGGSAILSAPSPVILFVASDNALNLKGLKDFLQFAWPIIRREVAGVELRIVGSVGANTEFDDPQIVNMGRIDDLPDAYAHARVIINPAVAGTGLKIKTVEAIFNLRPIVCWPSGVEGIEPDMQQFCRVATDWYSFARHTIDLCNREESDQVLIDRSALIRERFSADTVYRVLGETLNGLLRPKSQPPPHASAVAVDASVDNR